MSASADEPVSIRKLRAEDAAQWRRLRLEALRSCPAAFSMSFEEASRDDLAAFAAHIPQENAASALFGAFVDGRLCGSAGVHVSPRIKLRHKGEVWGVYVEGAQRGRGVGRLLLQAVVAYARTRVAVLQLAVGADNAAARALYRRLGFNAYGYERRALRIDGVDHDDELLAMYFDDLQGTP